MSFFGFLLLALSAHGEESFSGNPVPVWSHALPGGHTSSANHAERSRPVPTHDGLLLGTDAGAGLYLVSKQDGRTLRVYPSEASVQGSAVVLPEMVVFSDVSGVTYAYTHEGNLEWRHSSGSPILSTPLVEAGRVFLTNVDDLTVSLDVATGDLDWQYQRPKDATRTAELALFGAPTPILSNGQLISGYSDGYIVSLNPNTGEILWDTQVGEGRYPDLVGTPSSNTDDVFASGYFGPLVAIDVRTQNVRWRLDAGSADSGVIAESKDGSVLLHPGSDGTLRCVSLLTGGVKWEWKSGKNGALTMPVVRSGGVFVGATDGGLSRLDLETGEETWKANYGFLLEGITSAPVISGRELFFVTNAGNLYKMMVPIDDNVDSTATQDGWTRLTR
jgi:outer membrane protein assembly factor BamB